jgi:hypothetical protein
MLSVEVGGWGSELQAELKREASTIRSEVARSSKCISQ